MLVNIFASGTNIQRIAKNAGGNRVHGILDVAYSQLETHEENFVKRKYYSLQYNGLHDYLEAEFKPEHMPSWSKIWQKPIKCEKFLTTLFRGIVGEDDMLAGLSLSTAADEAISGIMVFTSADNKQMQQTEAMIRKALPEWKVVTLNGEAGYSNRIAQEEIVNEIQWAKDDSLKGIIIITNIMGSRSFSIPEIQASVIMYDRGSIDATSQKVSRSLTPGNTWDGQNKEFGHIFSFSFDPNRNEVIENIVLHEAIQVARAEKVEFVDAVNFVFKTVNIFNVDVDGDPILVSVDTLFKIYGENNNLLKVADVTVKLDDLNSTSYDILCSIRSNDKTAAKKLARLAPKPKSKQPTEKGTKESDDAAKEQKELEKILNEAIRTINRSATTVYNLVMEGSSYRGCLEHIIKNKTAYNEFEEFYGVTVEDVIVLLDEQILNAPLLDVIVQNSRVQEAWI